MTTRTKTLKLKLTHHFDACRRGQIKLLVPSTSPAGDPIRTLKRQKPSNHPNTDIQKVHLPYVSGLLVVVDVVDVSGQAEVGYLHHVIFCDEHVPGCQISVDTLKNRGDALQHSFTETRVYIFLYSLKVN